VATQVYEVGMSDKAETAAIHLWQDERTFGSMSRMRRPRRSRVSHNGATRSRPLAHDPPTRKGHPSVDGREAWMMNTGPPGYGQTRTAI
jgi:hypothetical protein